MTIKYSTNHEPEVAEEFAINVHENGASVNGVISLNLNDRSGGITGEGIIHDNNTDQDISVYVEGCSSSDEGTNTDHYVNDLKLYDKDTGAEVLNLSNNKWSALLNLVKAPSYCCGHIDLFGEYHDLDGNVTGGVVAEVTLPGFDNSPYCVPRYVAEEFTINVYENGASVNGVISLNRNGDSTITGEGIIHDNNTDQDISVYVEGFVSEYHRLDFTDDDLIFIDYYTNDLKLYDKDTGAEVLNLGNDQWAALLNLVKTTSFHFTMGSAHPVYLFGEYHDLDGNVTGGVVAEFTGIFD